MLALRLALAAVFLISGIAKAATPRATAGAAGDLGVPAGWTTAIAVLLPAVEILVAGLLVPTPTAVLGSVAGTALLAAFTVLIAVNLAHGRRPSCACFGALSAQAAISGRTLVRNGVLLAASVTVLVATLLPGECRAGCYDAAGGGQVLIGAGTVLAVAVGAGLVLIHSLTRMVGRLTERVRELEAALDRAGIPVPGGPDVAVRGAPQADLPALLRAAAAGIVTDPAGSPLRLADLVAAADRTLLVFLSSHCSACTRVRSQIEAVTEPDGLQFVAVTDDWGAVDPPVPGSALALFADGGQIAEAGGIRAFPSAIEVDAALRPSGTLMIGSIRIRQYLDTHRGALQRA
ncbi:MAG TPA: MauE/DoxX family redox-associated membrane protein [Nakamurella sp.]|nr:MauE/DoxX family redox-associated membrane protein [Nakamurella sp.]